MQYVARDMVERREGGIIVNVSSISSQSGSFGLLYKCACRCVAYCAMYIYSCLYDIGCRCIYTVYSKILNINMVSEQNNTELPWLECNNCT